ncbi:hypothetical protein KVG95_29200 [Pseudomonas sp. SWRI79]|uniref:Uncharacterized protein n=1 Tax=Pseudomonas farris TaxID=2841207 RepID=A0ABS6Q4P4_9PSED|nr:hypothetical protein [Pseudomonas farris]MBV4467396.1 hypothetical protein [Pseudomonas farris]
MSQPLFDLDLKRVSREHYITGQAAINFPATGGTTGGWQFLSYFDRESGIAKVSLAGIHYPDTTGFFGATGIFDSTDLLARHGRASEERPLFMADHYRAAADMIIRWALSESLYCNVEVNEWFPAEMDRQRLLDLLEVGRPKLCMLSKQKKVDAWLLSQSRY